LFFCSSIFLREEDKDVKRTGKYEMERGRKWDEQIRGMSEKYGRK
jgi:hypothetical protein